MRGHECKGGTRKKLGGEMMGWEQHFFYSSAAASKTAKVFSKCTEMMRSCSFVSCTCHWNEWWLDCTTRVTGRQQNHTDVPAANLLEYYRRAVFLHLCVDICMAQLHEYFWNYPSQLPLQNTNSTPWSSLKLNWSQLWRNSWLNGLSNLFI